MIGWGDADNDGLVGGSSQRLLKVDLRIWKDGVELGGAVRCPNVLGPGVYDGVLRRHGQ